MKPSQDQNYSGTACRRSCNFLDYHWNLLVRLVSCVPSAALAEHRLSPGRAEEIPLHSAALHGDARRMARRCHGLEVRSAALFLDHCDSRAERGSLLREGLISTARVILLGLVMDTIYQIIVFGTFYPVEPVIVALLLAFVPYVVMRGPIARVALWWRNRASTKRIPI
jgi:hypothetical protein